MRHVTENPGKTRGRVVRQQHGARVTHRDLDRSRFADMQCEQSDKGTKFGRWRFTGGSGAPSRLRPVEGCRTMTLNVAPNSGRHDHLGKIPQQVWTVQLIQMNDRTGIADDRPAGRFSRLHGVPIGRPPS